MIIQTNNNRQRIAITMALAMIYYNPDNSDIDLGGHSMSETGDVSLNWNGDTNPLLDLQKELGYVLNTEDEPRLVFMFDLLWKITAHQHKLNINEVYIIMGLSVLGDLDIYTLFSILRYDKHHLVGSNVTALCSSRGVVICTYINNKDTVNDITENLITKLYDGGKANKTELDYFQNILNFDCII